MVRLLVLEEGLLALKTNKASPGTISEVSSRIWAEGYPIKSYCRLWHDTQDPEVFVKKRPEEFLP